MNILLKIATYIIPFLIRFCDKHLEDFLEKLYLKIGMKLERRETEVKLSIVTNPGARVLIDLGEEKKERIAKDGIVSIIGIEEKIAPIVTVSLKGYKTETRNAGKMNESKVLFIDLESEDIDTNKVQEETRQFFKEVEIFIQEVERLRTKFEGLKIAKEYLGKCIQKSLP